MKKVTKYLVVGLGNPGAKYANTRHNAGFDVIDALKEKWNINNEKKSKSSLISIIKDDNSKIFIIKPQTFMNDSGIAVKRVAHFYRIKPENIIVVYDDMDIEIGKIRIRKKGSGGTHNGMKSIISHIKTYDFPRIRIGIGKPKANEDTVKFVLDKAKGVDKEKIDKAMNIAVEAIDHCLIDGIDKTMQKFNRQG